MKDVALDFDGGPRKRWFGQGGLRAQATACAATLTALAALVHAVWSHDRLTRAGDELRRQLNARNAAQTQTVAAPAPPPRLAPEAARQLDAAAARLNAPWSDIFDLLEQRTPRQVALLGLSPDASTERVSITAEARTLPELLSYARALQADSRVGHLRLAEHETRHDAPGQPVRAAVVLQLAR